VTVSEAVNLISHGETQMGWSLPVRRSSRLTESQSDMCRAR
jgi:hypothetical protein